MTRTILRGMALLLLLFFYAAAWLAPVIAPYSHRYQFRDFAFAPPSRIVFQSETGVRGPAFHAIWRLDLNPTYEQTGVAWNSKLICLVPAMRHSPCFCLELTNWVETSSLGSCLDRATR